jgi:hypothetical protein
MKIEVNDLLYQFSHGRAPRGRGSWAFFFGREQDIGSAYWFSGSYAEAKKAAIAEARRRNVNEVFVGS